MEFAEADKPVPELKEILIRILSRCPVKVLILEIDLKMLFARIVKITGTGKLFLKIKF